MDQESAEHAAPLGRLEVICGPMFAGKSTRLIERLSKARDAGLQVCAVKPALDDRYHPSHIAAHTGRTFEGRTITDPAELLDLRGEVIGLDEAHFFEHGLHGPVASLVGRGRRVIVAGLDRTSMNEPFHEMGLLLVEADEIEKLTAPCAICGRPAVHTIRLFDSTEPIVVGGEGMFENRCRAHLEHS